MRSGRLQTAINRYKYQGATGWASIFGRVLVGYLDDRPQIMEGWDGIIASPTFTGAGSRRQWDHVGLVLERARVEAADRWPIHTQPALIVKTKETPQLVSLGLSERRAIAATELREALNIPDPTAVWGRSFLVFDERIHGWMHVERSRPRS